MEQHLRAEAIRYIWGLRNIQPHLYQGGIQADIFIAGKSNLNCSKLAKSGQKSNKKQIVFILYEMQWLIWTFLEV